MQTLRIILVSICVLFTASYTEAAVVYLDPSTGTYGPGDTFIASVRVDNEGDCINAAHVEVEYPKEIVRAIDFSRGDSILSLWIEDPQIDTERGLVRFSGGVPGGYCGRTPGDPVLSNVLGKIIFTVVSAKRDSALIRVLPTSQVYENDGLGTEAQLTTHGISLAIVRDPTLSLNPWLKQVGEDTIPPDAFDVQVNSTRGVFGGKYYIAFSAIDKQSGLDHYEIFERGAWKRIESPYQMRDQLLRGEIQVRAIDKAGNERLGDYVEGSAPQRQSYPYGYAFIVVIICILAGALTVKMFWHRRSDKAAPPQA